MRRGWQAIAGTPQQRYNRAISRRAHRARVRAIGRRAAYNPYASRSRWYAPWRIWTQGGGLRDSFRRWRARRIAQIPRDHNGVRLPVLARVARRWNIRRGRYPGLGIGRVPLRARWRAAWYRNTSREIWGRRWGRLRTAFARGRPPRPLAARWQPGWLRNRMTRLDRRRQDRWLRRNRQTTPRTRRPLVLAPDVAGHMTGPSINGHGIARGGPMADTAAMADEIRSMGGGEFSGPEDVDNYLQNVHQLVQALQENLAAKADQMDEMGVHQAYPEAIREAAGSMAGIADQLESITSGGVMRGPGG